MRQGFNRCRCGRVPLFVLVCMLVPGAPALASGQLGLAIGHADNLGQTTSYGRSYSAGFLEATAGWTWAPRMPTWGGWTVQTDLATRRFDALEALSWYQGGIRAGVWRVLGRGFHAPTVWLDGGLAWRDHDSALRDGRRFEVAMRMSQRLSSALVLEAGLHFRDTDARSDIFSGFRQNLEIVAAWLPYAPWAAELRLFAGKGAFAAGTAAQNPDGWSGNWVPDDALSGQRAYRREGQIRGAGLTVYWQMQPQLGLNLDVSAVRTSSNDYAGGAYQSGSATLSWRYTR